MEQSSHQQCGCDLPYQQTTNLRGKKQIARSSSTRNRKRVASFLSTAAISSYSATNLVWCLFQVATHATSLLQHLDFLADNGVPMQFLVFGGSLLRHRQTIGLKSR